MRALVAKLKSQSGVAEVKLSGSIDENAAKPLADLASCTDAQFNFDFSGVDFVNSSGIREWMRFLRFASLAKRRVTVAGVRPNFVVAMMNLPALRDGVVVRSIFRSYVCPQKHRMEIMAAGAQFKGRARQNVAPCNKCGEAARADDEDEDFDVFLVE